MNRKQVSVPRRASHRCKHDFGWCILKDVYVFIDENNKVSFDFRSLDSKSYKLKMRCNYPECTAIRNIYIKGEVVKLGRIKHDKKVKGDLNV